MAAQLAALAEYVSSALPEVRGLVYSDLIRAALSPAAKRILEARMALPNYEFKSDFALKNQAVGRKEGREEGREIARGALLALLRRTYGDLPDWTVARLRSADLEELKRWLERSTSAASLEDLFDPPGPP